MNTDDSRSHSNQALLISTSLNVSRGETTLDTLRARGDRKRYICIPSDGLDGSEPTFGEVFTLDWNERVYDLGFKENWRTIFVEGRKR